MRNSEGNHSHKMHCSKKLKVQVSSEQRGGGSAQKYYKTGFECRESGFLSYILYGDFCHTFCVGISGIHFVWGFLSYILYGGGWRRRMLDLWKSSSLAMRGVRLKSFQY